MPPPSTSPRATPACSCVTDTFPPADVVRALTVTRQQILWNQGIFQTVMLGKALQAIFLGELRLIEVEVRTPSRSSRPPARHQEPLADSLADSSIETALAREGMVRRHRDPARVDHLQGRL